MKYELITLFLSLPVTLMAFYVIAKKKTYIKAFVYIGAPIVINVIDVFVTGNLTLLRQVFFAMWSFAALYVALGKDK